MQPGQANPFTNPNAPGAAGAAPRVADMEGCLVAFSPTAFTAAGTGDNLTGFEGSPPRDRVTTNVFLLETPRGPIAIGGTPETSAAKPHTHTVAGPARFSGVWVNNTNIVSALAPGGTPLVGSMVLGRIVRSEVGRRPWNLVAVDGTPDMALAVDIYNRLSLGQIQYNDPQPIGGFAAPAGAVSYAPPAAAPVDPAYAAWQAQQAQAAAAAAQPPAAPVDPAYAAWQAQQAAGNAAVAAAFPGAQVIAGYGQPVAPAAPVAAAPPGWNPQAWATLTPAQQSEVLRSMGHATLPA